MSRTLDASILERFELADQLLAGRDRMPEPQDLPGRYGRVVHAIDRVLAAIQCSSVVGGGWAVWRHGYDGRLTQDIHIALPADRVQEFLRVASVAGFDVLSQPPGRWPKLVHRETQVRVDILPEGERPGTPSHPAPTTLPHPSRLGAAGFALRYIRLPALIELKLAAGRTQDENDVVQLILTNGGEVDAIRRHLESVHADYVAAFDRLAGRAAEQQER